MHCRDIFEDEFDRNVAELAGAKHQGDGIEMVTGRHEDHGNVIPMRDDMPFVRQFVIMFWRDVGPCPTR